MLNPLTAFIPPMLASALGASETIDTYSNDGWVLEEKYDGHRLIVVVHEGGLVGAFSRQGKRRDEGKPGDLTPTLKQLLAKMAPGTYDGELYIPGHVSTDVTNMLLQDKLRLVLFDMLRVGTVSIMDRQLRERRTFLEAAFKLVKGQVLFASPQFPVSRGTLDGIWARGGEGVIAKRLAAIYQPNKRTKHWVKFKKLGAAQVTITGFTEGSLGPYSIIDAVDDHGVTVSVKALNDEWRASVLGPHLIGTRMVISYHEKHRSGSYREPRADHLLLASEQPERETLTHPTGKVVPFRKTQPSASSRKSTKQLGLLED